MRILRPLMLSILFMPALHTVGKAHEFWIEPKNYSVAPGEPVAADLRNGQNFHGAAQPWYEPRNARVEQVLGGEAQVIESRPGDIPAMTLTPGAEGLMVLVHQTTPTVLTYEDWETVLAFVAHKDFPWFEARHAERGLPREKVREVYTRFSKSLVAVGRGAGADAEMGLEVEFVALANPYADDMSGGLPVRLLYRGAPRGHAQVEVYEKDAAGDVAHSVLRTGPRGEVLVPVRTGFSYLLDHVELREPQGAEAERAMWESLWASLTFALP